jgi:hypothetical protein
VPELANRKPENLFAKMVEVNTEKTGPQAPRREAGRRLGRPGQRTAEKANLLSFSERRKIEHHQDRPKNRGRFFLSLCQFREIPV